MKEVLEIKNELGLHARAAAKFVEITNKFDSEILITVDNSTFDGKSIMGLLSIGVKKGDNIELAVSGSDEEEAMEAIRNLINKELLNL